MNRWTEGGFQFDTGPSLITMPWVFRELYEDIGERLDEHLDLLPLTPLARYVFADGVRFDWHTDTSRLLETLHALNPGDAAQWPNFVALGKRLYELSKKTFLEHPVGHVPPWANIGTFLNTPWRHFSLRYTHLVNMYFRSPHLRMVMNRYPTYVGSSPYQCPAMFAVIPYIEHAFGGWHIRGGLYTLIQSLVTIGERLGVEIKTNATVQCIDTEAGKVTGVTLDGPTHLPAEVVVMNGDASCLPGLLGDSEGQGTPRHLSLSGFVMMLGIKRKLPDLLHHNVFFTRDYQKEFSQLFELRVFPKDPTVYVCVASKTDASAAPPNGESLFIMANAPASDPSVWTFAMREEARRRVLARLAASGLTIAECDIHVEKILTPAHLHESYLMPGGAIYGAASHGIRNAFLRPAARVRGYAGLYRVGGSGHPGGGTPNVVLSSKITVDLIERHEHSTFHEVA